MRLAAVHARACILLGLLCAAPASAGGVDARILLDADFDAEPLDVMIGTGGPALGQPIHIDPDLLAIVRGTPRPSPSLEFAHDVPGLARTLRFEFPGSEEVVHGDVELRFTFRAEQLDHFSLVYVREQGGSAQSFLTMTLDPVGGISAGDASGEPAIDIGTYLPGVDHRVHVTFHLDAGTWDLSLDDVTVVVGRPHGVEDRGIGRLLFGTHHQTEAGSLLYIDTLRVRRGDGIFADGFGELSTPADAG
jgi:hypothetical protein